MNWGYLLNKKISYLYGLKQQIENIASKKVGNHFYWNWIQTLQLKDSLKIFKVLQIRPQPRINLKQITDQKEKNNQQLGGS